MRQTVILERLTEKSASMFLLNTVFQVTFEKKMHAACIHLYTVLSTS